MAMILVVDDQELNRPVLTRLLFEAGAEAFLRKPADNDDYLAAVENLIAQRGEASRIAPK